MNVNLFKFPNSKRHGSFSKQQSNSNSSSNIIDFQEPSNDYCRPISVFNSQRGSQIYNEQNRFQQVEIKDSLSKDHDHVIINNKLEEHIIDQSTRFNMKDSSIMTMNTKKISAEFTNDDSAAYNFSKELIIGPVTNDGTNTTFFSMISSQASIKDKPINKKNSTTSIPENSNINATATAVAVLNNNTKKCECPHRHSIGLNTKELIRITNQRKALFNKIEQHNKKEVISRHSNSYENNADCLHKDIQQQPVINDKEDNLLTKINHNDNDDNSLDIPLMLSPSSKQLNHNGLMSELINYNISKDLGNNNEEVDNERFRIIDNVHLDYNEIDTLEFKIEQGNEGGIGEEITSNKNESFSEEKLLSQNEPYNVTMTTQKELETEINEFDIDRNRMQNETKIMNSIDISSSLIVNYDNKEDEKRDNQENHKVNEAQIQVELIRDEKDTFQKINFFEETLQKIQPNKEAHKVVFTDSSNNNCSKKVNYDNNRYDKKLIQNNIKKDMMIPHPIIINRNSLKAQKGSIDNNKILDDITVPKLPLRNNKSNLKVEENSKQIKKQRRLTNYTDLYNKKNNDSSSLDIPLPMPNNPLIKKATHKAKNRSCDVSDLFPLPNDTPINPKINSHRVKHNYNISNQNTRNSSANNNNKHNHPPNSTKANKDRYHCFNNRINFGQKALKNKEVIYDSLEIVQ